MMKKSDEEQDGEKEKWAHNQTGQWKAEGMV